jgi:hypothetical protein
VGSATELPFGDGEFDIAMQFTCLSSIVDNKVRKDAAREMQRVARGGWVLSLDLRGPTRFSRRGSGSTLTPTVALDKQELHRLFGEPSLLRGVALAFNLAQLKGQHRVLSGVLSLAPPQRSHLLGLWRVAKGGDRFDRAALAVADGRVRLTKTDSRNETRSGRSPS